jgi:hypothetical protein
MHDALLFAFGVEEFVNIEDFTKLVVHLLLNLTGALIVIRGFYVRRDKSEDQILTFYAFSVVTFGLCFLLRKVPTELGFALGLFAVFGILRYRTEAIRIRDLTYLFVIIGLAILNAMANKDVSILELLMINAAIVGTVAVLERGTARPSLVERTVHYDNLALLLPGKATELATDLERRTGLRVIRVHVDHVDLLKDTASLRVECEPGAIEVRTP